MNPKMLITINLKSFFKVVKRNSMLRLYLFKNCTYQTCIDVVFDQKLLKRYFNLSFEVSVGAFFLDSAI